MMERKRLIEKLLFILTFFTVISGQVNAQYFGKNKPGYKKIEYRVFETPHFNIYHYFDDDSLLVRWATEAEKWYAQHNLIFQDSFELKNPLILYADHADFQETTAISSTVSVGTGGVTEAFKNRVVMPVAVSDAQTDHVLGHELVHAFQFHMLTTGESTSLASTRNLPLWMTEGLAEYMSIGSTDAQTAMWMRDALLQDDFPSLKDLTRKSKYFPYRYGHAFWAMVGKVWGDDKIKPLYLKTAILGYEAAIDSVLGISAESFSDIWKSSYISHYSKYLTDSVDRMSGTKLFDENNAGRMNISPSVSPDGKYVVFYSEKDVISIDLFLAEAESGKIIKKLSSRVHRSEIDDFNFLESAGTWSPDGKKFAFVVFSKGINKLVIVNVKNGKVLEEIAIPGVPAFYNPTWSPDGRTIVVSGLVRGNVDLYAYDMVNHDAVRLTRDRYAELQPCWSWDGKYIVFSTDRPSGTSRGVEEDMGYRLALLEVETGRVTLLPLFPGADNLNPVFSPDNGSLYFLSNADGFRNLYRYDLEEEEVYRMTSYMTGISGITSMSPAISVARDVDRIVYSYYWKSGYQVFSAEKDNFFPTKIPADSVNLEAAVLPPSTRVGLNLVDNFFENEPETTDLQIEFNEVEYRPRFKLDYISNVNMGVSTTSRYGSGMAGSVIMLFSDMVGDNQIFAQLAVNGEIYDFGGQFAYLNQKSKINWGSTVSHIPYLSGSFAIVTDTIKYGDSYILADNFILDYLRMFEDQVSFFSYLPLSTTRRFEAGTSLSRYYYRIDRYNNYYDYYTGYPLGATREKLDAPPGFTLHKMDIAYVGDNSYFGFTSPVRGHRMRLAVEKYTGKLNMFTALADYRKYFNLSPFTLAFRAYHFGRYGKSAESNILYPLYLGYPWLIRGYNLNSFNTQQALFNTQYSVNQLAGSRIAVANAEVRIPLSGPERMGLIRFKYLPTELALFADAGVAWDSRNKPVLKWMPETETERVPVMSVGASVRVNLMGALIFEPFYAFPVKRGVKKGTFGLNFIPGW